MTDNATILRTNPGDIDSSSIEALVGDEDVQGVLDRYKVEVIDGKDGQPVIIWRCNEGCGPNGNGHVGVIIRNLDMDQTNLTLGELVGAALAHAEEEHDEDYGLEKP